MGESNHVGIRESKKLGIAIMLSALNMRFRDLLSMSMRLGVDSLIVHVFWHPKDVQGTTGNFDLTPINTALFGISCMIYINIRLVLREMGIESPLNDISCAQDPKN